MSELPSALDGWEKWNGQYPQQWPGLAAATRVINKVEAKLTDHFDNAERANNVMFEVKDKAKPDVQPFAKKSAGRLSEILNDNDAAPEDRDRASKLLEELSPKMDVKLREAWIKRLAIQYPGPTEAAKAEIQQEDEGRLVPRRYYVCEYLCKLISTPDNTKTEDWFETEPLSAWAIANIVSLQLVTYSKGGIHNPDHEKGSWSWFEISIRGENDIGTPKKLPGGQSLAWFSHANTYNDNTIQSHRGRVFTKEDKVFEHLKPKDRISVSVAACLGYKNIAKRAYLLLGFEKKDVELHQKLRFPPTENAAEEDDPLPPSILVCGQERRDCFMLPDDSPSSATKVTMIDGGVRLMRRLLEDNNWSVISRPEEPAVRQTQVPPGFHSILPLAKDKKALDEGKKNPPLKVGKQTVVSAGPVMVHNWQNPQAPEAPRIVVWDDYGVSEANMDDYIYNLENNNPTSKVLLYQMHVPLCQGVLWEDFRPFKKSIAESRHLPKTLVVIDMDDLRAQGFNISRGISWEKTMEDFRGNVRGILKELKLPWYMHLIVHCGYEGVIYVAERPQQDAADPPPIDFVTYMVPNMAEGQILRPYNGSIPGIDIAFVTGLAASLVKESNSALDKLEPVTVGQAIEVAIARSHRFALSGFVPDANGAIDYPRAQDVTNAELPRPGIIHINSDWFKNDDDGKWSLFSLAETWKEHVAAETVKTGTKFIEAFVPTAQYGPLVTADRSEIEGFRSVEVVIKQYLDGDVQKPLSIAVFGQPGSGKSFGVKKVIDAVINDKKQKPIEANLSQFVDYKDLLSIFDSVRDMSSKSNHVPVVLFDEFDSPFGSKALGWLKYFLAPMQDNQYLHKGTMRSLGRAIFVFIGGTSSSFEEFSQVGGVVRPAQAPVTGAAGGNSDGDHDEMERYEKQAKKPDFISRLSAHVNVAGPNPPKRDNPFVNVDDDKMVIMRRAMLLRSLLETRLDLMKKAIQVDETLLMALLKHERFPHGSRSLELILQSSRVSSGQKLQPSALPPDSQLAMHLNLVEYQAAMSDKLHETEFRPYDVILYNKLRWAAWARDKLLGGEVAG
ncbi:hypothetical protein FPSE_05498 [Fusarium pseudograminearum CS3096]|uniref:Uncharacterized protein n=1 Tax=Fusarium pseudograminearum (strain CS3096) TaxID=1028729 RepID=K3UPG0_FUSPC|nr:hypothetical protein FPSE_05498 [Fusarium pseudograminearum CS3096]EKJ74201.1 hypothetical protein FPSE_05498 [Fusarium pseudograminearum CS3096]KAF0637421.1 hypothetical protein FPSE5266_05498 [Fusarium pseudograminearum]